MASLILDLYDPVRLECPGLSKPLFLQKAVELLRDFFEYTQAYQYTIDPITVKPTLLEYDIDDNPKQTEINAIYSAVLSGTTLINGEKYRMGQNDRKVIVLKDQPPAELRNALIVTLILVPSRNATQIDSDLLERYYDRLVNGIKHWLMRMPAVSWSNPTMAQYYGGLYNQARASVRRTVNRGVGTQRVLKTAWRT
jgi:hypothetical protein